MKKRIGLMGCGTVARYGHLPAIAKTADLDLVALYDPFEESLRDVGATYHVDNLFTDADAFFASGLDGVTITSPAPCHLENVLGAARHRLPVVCEKPLAMTAADGEAMRAAMETAGVPLFVGFVYRFSPSALAIRELVRSGAVGTVRSLRLIYNWDLHGKFRTLPDGTRVEQERRIGRMEEGGPMVDCGTHQIDLAQWWLGSPVVRFRGHGAWVDRFEEPDHVWVHMDHANGAHTCVEISYSYGHTITGPRREFVYELIGAEGVIRYDREAESFTVHNAEGRRELAFHHEKDFTGMYEEFARVLNGASTDLLATAAEGIGTTRIAREATEEAKRNRGAH